MAKVIEIKHIHDGREYHQRQFMWYCKGCGHTHVFSIASEGKDGHHSWNGNFDKPSVSPSLVANFTPGKMCHSYILEGKVQYLSDCHHPLAGTTIELPEIESGGDKGGAIVDGVWMNG